MSDNVRKVIEEIDGVVLALKATGNKHWRLYAIAAAELREFLPPGRETSDTRPPELLGEGDA